MRRRQIFAMMSRQTATNPSVAAVAVPAAGGPSPVSREQEEATQQIWEAPPKRKRLSLKGKRNG